MIIHTIRYILGTKSPPSPQHSLSASEMDRNLPVSVRLLPAVRERKPRADEDRYSLV